MVSELTLKRHVANILTEMELPMRTGAATDREGWV
jgi:hypothetical protein